MRNEDVTDDVVYNLSELRHYTQTAATLDLQSKGFFFFY